MTIEEAIRAYLLTRTAVTALTTVIRADVLDQRDKPQTTACIVISVDEENPCNTLDGSGGLVFAMISVASLCGNEAKARQLAKAVQKNGTDPGTGLDGCNVTTGDLPFDAQREQTTAGYWPNEDGSPSGIFAVISKYTVSFYEAV